MDAIKHAFTQTGNWYKGNLHTHTNCSDGPMTPEETVDTYKSRGYDFLAMSDHNIYGCGSGLGQSDFLVVPAVEINLSVAGEAAKSYHLVGFSCPAAGAGSSYENGRRFTPPKWEGLSTAQSVIDELRAHGNLVVLAHPVWSRIEATDIVGLKHLTGIEVYNHGNEKDSHSGYEETCWDHLLRHGERVWGFASDDLHYLPYLCGGWIMVRSCALTLSAIGRAIAEGDFYATMGPEFRDFYVKNGVAHVDCSPVEAVHFVTYERIGKSCHGFDRPLTGASYHLQGDESYVRAVLEDDRGRKAWSNPIFLKDDGRGQSD